MASYFNTAFSLSMLASDCALRVQKGISESAAAVWLRQSDVKNVANPNHGNTLDAVSKRLGVDVRSASGGRVVLSQGDQVLVAQVSFPPDVPRETKEYTDEQVARGRFSFDLVTVEE